MYFLTSSVAFETLRTKKDELLFKYQAKLEETLDKLGYRGYVPTLLEFHVEFLKRGILGTQIV